MFSLENNPAGRSKSVPKPHDADHRADLSGLDVTELEDPQEALAAFQAGLSEQLTPHLAMAQKALAKAKAMKSEIEAVKTKLEGQNLDNDTLKNLERQLDELIGLQLASLGEADGLMDAGEAERKAA